MKVNHLVNKITKLGKGDKMYLDINKYTSIEIYANDKRVGYIPSGIMFDKMYIEIKDDNMYLSINNNIVASYWYIDYVIINEA